MFGQKKSYYISSLSGLRLKKCYDLAPPRVRGYLRAEVDFVLDHISPAGWTLDLGCGYGRIIPYLLRKAEKVVGIDNSRPNLAFARRYLRGFSRFHLLAMDAARLGWADGVFSNVLCIQNGISAFHTDPKRLIGEAVRVTRRGGVVLFSTYAHAFWEDRLDWFRLQAERGLVGEIDEDKTRPGLIVCRDGFRATTFSADDFLKLTHGLDAEVKIVEVDASSLFCMILPC
jgi:SAM-dependent methyltransferase